MGDGVLYRHTLEVVYLATTQDGGQYLVLLGGGKNEDDMCRRFLEGLEEGIEGGRREHVHLVDDKDLVLTHLRRDARLLHQRLDVLHRVVGGGVEFEDVQRTLLIKRLARLTLVASLALGRRVLTVDGLGKDTGTGGLAHASWSAEQIGMSQFAALHSILQRGGQCRLAHHRVERHGTVFSCRYDIFHTISSLIRMQR